MLLLLVVALFLPVICVAASWIIAFTSRSGRFAHVMVASALSTLFCLWLLYFALNRFEMVTWYGIFVMWIILMIQAGFFLRSASREAQAEEDTKNKVE